MSAFTFTAPTISEADEQSEREALTAAERDELQNDLFGTCELLDETDEAIQSGTLLMREALESIPETEKEDYMHAMETVPELVQHETPAIAFWRAAKWDPWAAASRLNSYWLARRKAFGPRKAFLPMRLDGAMVDEIEQLEKAVIVTLPNDTKGRAVILLDRIRCIRSVIPRESVVRCLFYTLHCLAENDMHQKQGCVIIFNLRVCDWCRVLLVLGSPLNIRLGQLFFRRALISISTLTAY